MKMVYGIQGLIMGHLTAATTTVPCIVVLAMVYVIYSDCRAGSAHLIVAMRTM